MSGPPTEIAPSDLWLALTSIPRPHRLVDLPRCLPGSEQPVGQVAMWPMTQEEQMAVSAEADRFTKKLMQAPQRAGDANLGYEHAYSNEVAVQILWRVCRDPTDVARPAFPSPKLMRANLTADEVGVLFKQYLTVQAELGPIVAYMSDEEMEAWVRRIAAGGSAYPFDGLSLEAQRTLVLFMACQLVSCWTAISSAGSPPGAPQTSGAGPAKEGADAAPVVDTTLVEDDELPAPSPPEP